MQNGIKNVGTFGDYPVLAQKFVDFWGLLNAARVEAGEADLVMDDGFTRANLIAAQGELNAAIDAVGAREDARGLAIIDREEARMLAYDAMDSWRKRVTSKLRRTKYAENLPTLPGKTDTLSEFLKPFAAAINRWTSINEATQVPHFTPPLLLNDGMTLGQFGGVVTDVSAKSTAVALLEEQAGILRSDRDALLPPLKMHFEDLRAAVIDQYPADSVWVRSLPKLSEKSTLTPDGVAIKVAFEAAAGGWKISWRAPDALDVERFSVRIAAGPRYKGEGEKTIGDLAPNVTQWVVPEADVPSGAMVWVKVFVVNETGNEKGSNAVRLAR